MSFPQAHNFYRYPYHAQRGMVVVLALFMVAIIAALSYAMITSLSQDTHRTEMMINEIELTNQAEGAILWAKDLLITNLQRKAKDKRVDIIPYTSPVNDTGRFRIVSRIYDMQARYNINLLGEVGENEKERSAEFIRLMKALQLKLNDDELIKLTEAIKEWLTDTHGGNSASNRYYEELPYPYRAANQKMAHVSELLLVKGMKRDIYNKLQPYVVALPEQGIVNILTASPSVLTTLQQGLTLEKAIVLERAMTNLKTSEVEGAKKNELIKSYNIQKFVVVSEFFLIETRATLESQQLIIYTLMQRTPATDPNKVDVRIVWQSKGIA